MSILRKITLHVYDYWQIGFFFMPSDKSARHGVKMHACLYYLFIYYVIIYKHEFRENKWNEIKMYTPGTWVN